MKKFYCLAAMTLSAGLLAGCSEFQQAEEFLTSPQTQQSIATLEQVSTLFVCDIADASAVAAQIESAVDADQAVQGTNGKVYVTASILCQSLGGVVAGSIAKAAIGATAGSQ
jgi:hypothetical protein